MWVLTEGKFQPWQGWKMLGMFGGILCRSPVNFLGRSYEVLAVGPNDSGGQTQRSWRSFPASVMLWLYSMTPSSIGGPMKFLWRSHTLSGWPHPGLHIIFTAFPELSVTPELILGNLCWVDPGWHWLLTTQTQQHLQQLFGRAEVGAALTDPGPCSDQVPSTASALF